MNKNIKRIKTYLCMMAVAVLCLGLLAGCGDGIKKETSDIVKQKTDTALQLYGDIEKMVQENALVADESFTAMKTKLTEMSGKVKEKIAETTEEDGQLVITELDAMIKNLTEVKEKVQKKIEGTEK